MAVGFDWWEYSGLELGAGGFEQDSKPPTPNRGGLTFYYVLNNDNIGTAFDLRELISSDDMALKLGKEISVQVVVSNALFA